MSGAVASGFDKKSTVAHFLCSTAGVTSPWPVRKITAQRTVLFTYLRIDLRAIH
ncbi:hypothetical protein A8V23_19550 [Yersinia pestis]|uniref:Uncharacterized protein n=4 Tax=Yersinia pestis TaxID=632 RepID=A0AAP0VKJ4_YERPE|nr:hypothetical protein [Yersinia pestis]AAM85303.1 hypothetical [Yersinia pestis KIM10+]ABG13918.1 hypothetical protein YPA_1952 [Yersinia pestis Antiqua]ABG18379.1 hypothetical protein YPN_2050 [Yersinia pestis Nepal516]ABX86598.1 conserved hypothetical protein [Yersinia pestis Angola]ADV98287.1 hypothetical protein YPC_1673 [Yersinia pestis biovar Medievalis str. Harbin 35]EDM42124.1 hypothetical protein YPE_0805 [Yersinia pestis CA88-4125]EDR48730.1 conserved hypothetical protein [Yersin